MASLACASSSNARNFAQGFKWENKEYLQHHNKNNAVASVTKNRRHGSVFLTCKVLPSLIAEEMSLRKAQSAESNSKAMSTAVAATLAVTPTETAEIGLDGKMREKKNICLFYFSESHDLACRIAAESDAIELRSINWRNFADGFPNLFIPNAHGIRGQHVAFLASFSSPRVIFEQISIIYTLPRMFVSSFTLVLPFFPTGSYERMEEEGDVATAFTLARILSNIPISRGGPTSLVIFDIHALQGLHAKYGNERSVNYAYGMGKLACKVLIPELPASPLGIESKKCAFCPRDSPTDGFFLFFLFRSEGPGGSISQIKALLSIQAYDISAFVDGLEARGQ
ncbi:hypothetical protein KI387_015451, partial [Taxus chinensis]